jgi:hypothetical protein
MVATVGALAAVAKALVGEAAAAEPPWGSETPPFNVQVGRLGVPQPTSARGTSAKNQVSPPQPRHSGSSATG